MLKRFNKIQYLRMKSYTLRLTGVLMLCMVQASYAQWSHYDTTGFFTKDSISKKGYTLIFINKDSLFDQHVKQGLIKTFFTVYPKEARRFNPQTARKVTFIIDPGYDGVAATGNTVVRFNPQWFKGHPQDIDVVTHEAMHVVQAYHSRKVPGWLTEGIADYVRYVYGVNNKAADWAMPNYTAKQSYKNAYRVTARFLVWVEKKYNKSIVDKLDAAARDDTYSADLWKELTGKTVDELWELYGKNPALKLRYR